MEIKVPEKKQSVGENDIKTRMNAWPECYYRESEGAVRKKLLDEAIAENLTPKENEIRMYLWQKRYPGMIPGAKTSILDYYLRTWFDFRYASDNAHSAFSKNRTVKLIRKDMKEMGFDALELYGEAGRNLLYQELYHMGMLYITLCQTDKHYGSVFLGFGKMSDARMVRKIAQEVVKVAYYLPEALNMEEELTLWTKAIDNSFRDYFPNDNGVLDEELGQKPSGK